jgi:uncharacterized protein (UPF0147 family)
MFLGKYQELIQLVDRLERGDAEFGQDLWLMAERIILSRLTRSQDKKSDLDSIFHVIQQISKPENLPRVTKSEVGENLSATVEEHPNLSSSFSQAVDMLEEMDSSQLYKLITWLRNEKAFEFEKSLVQYYQSKQQS